MKASEGTTIILTAAAAATACVEALEPFNPVFHAWWVALAVTTAGAYLLVSGSAAIITGRGSPIALASLGGALLAACVAVAAFLVGQPQRVPAAPGQTYRPPRDARVAVEFPPAPAVTRANAVWPSDVILDDGTAKRIARPGDTLRAGALVFRVALGPIAYVDVRGGHNQPVTVTQPDGAAFLSPFLTFNNLDGNQPEDYFAVPALHRTVQVDYWPGLPSRGIDVPFVALRISEENGGPLYEGVAVSGRTLRKAGIALTFSLGSYPVVTASSAPPLVPFWAGLALVAFGWLNAAIGLIRIGLTRRKPAPASRPLSHKAE